VVSGLFRQSMGRHWAKILMLQAAMVAHFEMEQWPSSRSASRSRSTTRGRGRGLRWQHTVASHTGAPSRLPPSPSWTFHPRAFHLVNHGVPPGLVDAMQTVGLAFFRMPMAGNIQFGCRPTQGRHR
jgi:hypothetical protein